MTKKKKTKIGKFKLNAVDTATGRVFELPIGKKAVSAWIARNRKKKGLSLQHISDRLGVTRQAVYKWETGVNLPTVENMIEMVMIFDDEKVKAQETKLEEAESVLLRHANMGSA